MNLAIVSYWSTEYPFIDRMKSAGTWSAQGNGTVGAVSLDADGYPTRMPSGASNLYTMVALDPASAGTSRTYVLTYSGQATIAIPGTTIVSSKPGEIVFRYNGDAETVHQQIKISGLSDKNPIGDMHLVRQDQVSLHQAGEIFNPAFLDKISSFDTLRYMDWGITNVTEVKSWSDRTTVDDMSWASTNASSGVPVEVMVALANKTGTNMWLDVPTQASDDYVRKMMTYVRDNLDPSLKVTLEYSNEVWNWGFQQSRYAQDQADKLWGVDANGNGKIDNAESVARGVNIFYGYRSAQVASIANDVFGAAGASRLDTVLATQTVNRGLESYMFQGVEKAKLGTAATLFDDYAIATYFGFDSATAADRATILSWARSGAQGMDAAFKEMTAGGGLSVDFSLASLARHAAYQAGVANRYGLDLVAYEGGLGLDAYGFTTAEQAEVMALYAKLSSDPRMGALYDRMIGDFAAAGGTLMTAYTDARPDSMHGTFGTLKSIYDETSPAYAALVKAQTVVQATTVASTDYKFDAVTKTITYTGDADFSATGNDLDNVITGGGRANRLFGGGGNDTLTGGKGNDWLDGGTGNDRMIGKGGNDVYIVDSLGDTVIEDADAGIDEIRTTLSRYALPANVEVLSYTGAGTFTGIGNTLNNTINGGNGGAILSGGAGNDTLNGGASNDVLDGGVGNDVMTGGTGNDIYIVDAVGDRVVEAPNEGIDEVRTTLAAYTLGAEVEKLAYTGTGAFTGTGNILNNKITGGAGPNKLYGLEGNDVLIGGAGNDLLDGGAGVDQMTGGAGNDTYVVDSVRDVIVELANEGTDEVRTTLATYQLDANLENLTYVGVAGFTGTGNQAANVISAGSGGNSTLYGLEGNDTLHGGAGNDLLDGGTGADRMIGGGGNDTYIVENAGDLVVEALGGGTDVVRTNLASYQLTPNVENLVFTGTGAFSGHGSAVDNIITGSTTGRNVLNGNAGNDRLIGGAFNDTLDGGVGADRMEGGLGDDSYMVDNVGDVVVEGLNGGSDTVFSSISYTLSANVEHLRLVGNDAIRGGGNDLANIMVGNAGANTMSGGAGDDTISGNEGDDQLYGDAGNDTLSGGAGDDVLVGGAGADWLNGGAGADRFVFAPGDLTVTNSDTIWDFSRAEGDKIDLSAYDAIAGTPKNDAFTFIGDSSFSKHAGELRAFKGGNYWMMQGDTNGDGVADFNLSIGLTALKFIASDFIL